MRLKITLEPLKPERLILSTHHNDVLQGFIYRNLSRAIARRVHNRGYRTGKRVFRLFAFSRLFGAFRHENGRIVYQGKCTLWLASPQTDILESFASTMARKGMVTLGKNTCRISAIEVPFQHPESAEVLVRTLSPITMYTTLITKDNRKKTYYYTPFEREFSLLLRENLLKKHALVSNAEHEDLAFSITPEKVSKKNEHVIMYKDTVIKAWDGIYRISGTPELIKTAFDCGLGSKNSQGFGMIEKWEQRHKSGKEKKNE